MCLSLCSCNGGIEMSLYEVYIDYKNGDKAAFDRIFTDRVNGLGSDDYNSCLEVNV